MTHAPIRRSSCLALLCLLWPAVPRAQPAPPPAAPRVQAVAPAPAPPPAAAAFEDKLASAFVARGLTADEVARRARATSFDVQARQAEVAVAAAQLYQVKLTYLPRLTGQLRYARLSPITLPPLGNVLVTDPSVPPGVLPAGAPIVNHSITFPVLLNSTVTQLGLFVPVSDHVLRIARQQVSLEHSRDAARHNERAAGAKAQSDARLLYYSWARARLQIIVAEQSVTQVQGHLGNLQRALAVGTVSKADVFRVESQLANAELLRVRARSLADLLEFQLRTAMHDGGTGPYQIGEDLRRDLPAGAAAAGDESADPPVLFDEAVRGRPELRALLEVARAQHQQVRAATAGYYPRFDVFGDVQYSNPNQRFIPQQDRFDATWDVGLQLTWVFNDIAQAGGLSREWRARVRQTEAQASALRDALRVEVMQALQAIKEARAAETTTARGLRAAEESYRVRSDLYQNGRATTVELTDAETELTRARLDAVNARIDLRVARVRLDHALGRDAQEIR
jgi:outer membrane protein TolC